MKSESKPLEALCELEDKFNLMREHRPSKFPTLNHIVTLAAGLARNADEPAAQLAARALAVWRECRETVLRVADDEGPIGEARHEYRQRLASESRSSKRKRRLEAEAIAKIQKPDKFPVPADALPRLAVPSLRGRTAEAAKSLKGWLWSLECDRRMTQALDKGEDESKVSLKPEPNLISQLFADWRKLSLSEREFAEAARSFASQYASRKSYIRAKSGAMHGKVRNKPDMANKRRNRKKL